MIEHQGMILWLTGLPGSGKSTCAKVLAQKLKAEGGRCRILGSDQLRKFYYENVDLSRTERIREMEIVAKTAFTLKEEGMICILVATVPFMRVKASLPNETGTVEIFLDASLEVCKGRGPKSMYKKAVRGDIANCTGVAESYEEPQNPHLHLHTDIESPAESCNRIISYLAGKGFIDERSDYFDAIYRPNSFEQILSSFPFSSLLLLKQKIRKSIEDGICAFVDDVLQFTKIRRYKYRHKILFISGLPKSGTTWMLTMLDMIPGYHARPIYEPSRATSFDNLTPLVFDLMPNYSYSVVKLHTQYSPYNFETICNRVGRFVVLYRDLRDMCISRYFHVLSQSDHRHSALYRSSCEEEGIFHCMNIIKMEYVEWVRNWHEVASMYPERILEVRYEDLNRNAADTMKRVLAFFEIEYHESLIERMLNTQLQKPVDLEDSLKKGDTRRKGIVGDWKSYFSEDHKNYFKKMAGDLLISIGYEKDLDW